jgi:hypothetical protein
MLNFTRLPVYELEAPKTLIGRINAVVSLSLIRRLPGSRRPRPPSARHPRVPPRHPGACELAQIAVNLKPALVALLHPCPDFLGDFFFSFSWYHEVLEIIRRFVDDEDGKTKDKSVPPAAANKQFFVRNVHSRNGKKL